MKQFLTSLLLGGALGAAPTAQDYPPWDAADSRANVHIGMLARLTRLSCGPVEYVTQRLAIHHVNTRNSSLSPAIAGLDDNFYLSYDMFDSNGNGIVTTTRGLEMLGVTNDVPSVTKEAKVLIGPWSSDPTIKSNPVFGIFGVPQIGWAATNAKLSNTNEHPYYYRTVPPDSFGMAEMVRFVAALLPGKDVHILYSDGGFQKAQAMDFVSSWATTFTSATDPELLSWKFKPSGEGGAAIKDDETSKAEVQNALNSIKKSESRVCVLFVMGDEGNDVIDMINANGMIAEGYVWMGTDGIGTMYIPPERASLYKGVLAFQALSSSLRTPAFAEMWARELPTMNIPEFNTHQICGSGMTDLCKDNDDFTWYDSGMTKTDGTTRAAPGGTEDEHRTKLQCVGYTPFAYDAIVAAAVAIDKAIKTKVAAGMAAAAAASAITGKDIAAELGTIGESDNLVGLAAGKLWFNDEHWRPVPMEILNFDGVSGSGRRVAEVHGGTTYWCDSTIADSQTPGYCDGSTNGKALAVWSDGSVGFENLPTGAPPVIVCADNQVVINDQCDFCPAGEYPSVGSNGKKSCTAAPAGTYASGEMADPLPCAAGKYSARGQASCDPCPAGEVSSSGSAECTKCAPGMFQAKEEQATCERCPIGQWTSQLGSVACVECDSGLTTLESGTTEEAMCGCPAGFFLADGAGKCAPCYEGFICPFGASEEATANSSAITSSRVAVLVQPGYHALKKDPMTAYLCTDYFGCGAPPSAEGSGIDCAQDNYKTNQNDERCGRPVGTCTDQFRDAESAACGICLDGYYRDGTGKCVDCGAASSAPLILVLLVGAGIVPAVYKMSGTSSGAEATSLLATGMALGMLVSLMQIVGTTQNLTLPWSEEVAKALAVFSVIMLDVSFLKADCVASSRAEAYMGSWIAPYYVIATAAVIWALCKVAGKPLVGNRMISSAGQVVQALYITFVTIALRPLVCYSHPSERAEQSSVQTMPSVLCGSDEHTPLVALGVLSTLFVSGGFFALCVYANMVAKRKSAEADGAVFLARFRFLFYRFQTTHWYWGTALQLRSGLLSFVPIFAANNGALQIVLVTIILALYLALVCAAMPWKTDMLNFVDVAVTLLLLCFAAQSTAMSYPSQEVYDSLSVGVLVTLTLASLVALVAIVQGFHTLAKGGAKMNVAAVPEAQAKQLAADWEAIGAVLDKSAANDVMEGLTRQDARLAAQCIDMLKHEVYLRTGKSVKTGSKQYRISKHSGSTSLQKKAVAAEAAGETAA